MQAQHLSIVGIVTIRRHKAGIIDIMRAQHAAGQHEAADRLMKRGEVVTRSRNIVVDSANCGIDLLRQWFVSGLTSVIAYPLGPQWGEIGTGTATPTTADVALATPTARATLSYAQNSGGVASLQFFYSDAILANGTYHEFGTFVGDPTMTALGDGKMVNHVLFTSPYTKASGNDTTAEVDFTIANL